jgi:hypothetical protein
MIPIHELIRNRKQELPPENQPKIEYGFQELGVEMQEYFKPKYPSEVWALFYKYPEGLIRDSFKRCKKRGNTNVRYLVGIIKRCK